VLKPSSFRGSTKVEPYVFPVTSMMRRLYT